MGHFRDGAIYQAFSSVSPSNPWLDATVQHITPWPRHRASNSYPGRDDSANHYRHIKRFT